MAAGRPVSRVVQHQGFIEPVYARWRMQNGGVKTDEAGRPLGFFPRAQCFVPSALLSAPTYASFIAFSIAVPMSAGLMATSTPAACRALILASAVSSARR